MADLTAEIEQCLTRLEELNDSLPEFAERSARGKVASEVALAKARTTYRATQVEHAKKYTVGEVEDHALLQCRDERLEAELAEALYATRRDSLRMYQAKLSALQTLARLEAPI